MSKAKIEKNIFKLADKTYEIRLATNVKGPSSKKHFHRSCNGIKTLGEARRKLLEFKAELREFKVKAQKGIVTWEDAVEDYFKEAITHLSPSTVIDQKIGLKAHTLAWKNVPVESFCKSMIQGQIELSLSGRSQTTKTKIVKYIRNVFTHLVDRGVIKQNPATGISFKTPGMKLNRLQAMTREEVLYLLKRAREEQHPWEPIWMVSYGLGVRSGEGLALKGEHIDLENHSVHIVQAYCSKSKKIGPTKNKKHRVVPMSPELEVYFKELMLRRGKEEFLLPQFSEWKQGKAAKILNAYQKKLGIRQTNFHSLRASFITHLLLNGVSVVKVQHLVGHEELKTTERYIRLVASDLKGATNSIGVDFSKEEGEVIEFQSRS